MRMVIQLRNLILSLLKTDSHQVIFYLKFMVVLEQVLQPMALISLFRLHISLVDVFWTILIKD